ncbi:MAG: AAA family ATPase, partial [Fusobacteriaceae bacterium]|nr:AAA family ATPase [Fusobacteriaceae bacterium]
MKALPIGISDFQKIVSGNYFYADKSMLINEMLINGAEVTLFTRPRRFGKTLNMSMLYYFFNIKDANDNKKLFKGLNIEKTKSWKEQGKYPIIFISFKDIKASNWKECYDDIKNLMKDIFKKNSYIYESLDSFDK